MAAIFFALVLSIAVTAPPTDTQSGAAPASRSELVERTLAIVAGTSITLTDVRTAIALGLVDTGDDVAAASERLVERALVLREVERYAPQEPAAGRVDEKVSQLRDQFGAKTVDEILAAGGFTNARLRSWLRDDIRIATYLDQRFATDGPERRQSLIDDWVADLRRRTPVVELWKR